MVVCFMFVLSQTVMSQLVVKLIEIWYLVKGSLNKVKVIRLTDHKPK